MSPTTDPSLPDAPAAATSPAADAGEAVVGAGSAGPGPGEAAGTGIAAGAETVFRHFIAWTFGLGRNAWLFPLDLTFRFIGVQYGWLKALFETVPPRV
jgi:hypothetical protein